MARVELYFGAGHASAQAWKRFLAEVVTPRFPAGLTVLDGYGQWRGDDGRRMSEQTHVLVIYYRRDATSETRIESMTTLYRRRFRQTSVLRADTSACVSF